MGSVAPRHVGSSQTRARTRVPCIGRQTLNHCATREALLWLFLRILNLHSSCVCSGGGINRETRQPLVAILHITFTFEMIIVSHLLVLSKCPGLWGMLEKACLAVLESALNDSDRHYYITTNSQSHNHIIVNWSKGFGFWFWLHSPWGSDAWECKVGTWLGAHCHYITQLDFYVGRYSFRVKVLKHNFCFTTSIRFWVVENLYYPLTHKLWYFI